MKTLNTPVDDAVHTELKTLAARTGISMADLVRKAIYTAYAIPPELPVAATPNDS